MKAKVLKSFRDKNSGEIHKKGAVITITKKRFEEILSVDNLVEELKETTAKKAE